jgi:hypothetical protein
MLHSIAFLIVITVRALVWVLWILVKTISVILLFGILVSAFLAFVFGMWMLIHALIKERSGADKLGWAVVIVFVPVIGAMIYFFMRFLRRSAPQAVS